MSPVDAMTRFRATRLVAPTGFDYFVVFYISSNYSQDLLAFTEISRKNFVFFVSLRLILLLKGKAMKFANNVKCPHLYSTDRHFILILIY